MPKCLIGRNAKLDEVAKKIYRHVKADYPLKKLSDLMGYSISTHKNRGDDPGKFTLDQLRILYKLSDATDTEFLRMIREDKDARRGEGFV